SLTRRIHESALLAVLPVPIAPVLRCHAHDDKVKPIAIRYWPGRVSRSTSSGLSLPATMFLLCEIRPPNPRPKATVCAVTTGNIAELAATAFVALLVVLL